MLKNILFIANSIVGEKPGLSGGEVRFLELAKVWQKWGYKIYLFSGKGGQYLFEKFQIKGQVYPISSSINLSRIEFITRMIKLFFWRPKELNNFQGIIYSASEQIYDTWPAYFFKKKNPKKITWVTAVHWLPPWPPWKRKQSKWYNSIAFFLSERLGLLLAQKKADLLFPVSQSTAEQLKTIGLARSRYQVVECGVDYNTIQKIIQDVKTKKYQAIFLKRLQSVKGIFDLIDIWKMVVKKIPSARLAIIGEGIDSRRARELVQQKNLTNHIDFLGNIYDFKEKFKLLAQSQLFLLPTYEENWAIVIGEAMASNLPVIAYKLKELDQVWQDNYLKIPKGNKNLFAQQVVELLRDINQRQFWQNKGHQYVQRYDWTLIAQKELKLIESIR